MRFCYRYTDNEIFPKQQLIKFFSIGRLHLHLPLVPVNNNKSMYPVASFPMTRFLDEWRSGYPRSHSNSFIEFYKPTIRNSIRPCNCLVVNKLYQNIFITSRTISLFPIIGIIALVLRESAIKIDFEPSPSTEFLQSSHKLPTKYTVS